MFTKTLHQSKLSLQYLNTYTNVFPISLLAALNEV